MSKYLKSYCSFLLLLVVALTHITSIHGTNRVMSTSMLYFGDYPTGCVCDFKSDVDYFPVKLTPNHASTFDVSYHMHYKVVNTTGGNTFVLTQCGTPRPDPTSFPNGAIFVDIPISRVMVGSTTFIPWIEFLGERRSIVAVSQANTVSSPCLNKRLRDSEDMADVYDASTYSVDDTLLTNANVDVAFCSAGWGCPLSTPGVTSIPVTAQQETSVLAEAEHVEFFSLFYNREEAASDVVENIDRRFECLTETANVSSTRPRVVWAYFYGSYWYVGRCPNYYCELVAAAGGEMITNFPTGSPSAWGGLTDSEFLSAAADADILLYTGQNYWSVDAYGSAAIRTGPSNKTSVLEQMKAFRDGRVYDTLGNGDRDWLESRVAEPDVVLQDLLHVMHDDVTNDENDLVWWRRVEPLRPFDPPSQSYLCPDPTAPLGLKATGTCSELYPVHGAVTPSLVVTSSGDFVCDDNTGIPVMCDADCKTCDGPTSSDCLSCHPGYAVTLGGTCRAFTGFSEGASDEDNVATGTVILLCVVALSAGFIVGMLVLRSVWMKRAPAQKYRSVIPVGSSSSVVEKANARDVPASDRSHPL